MNRIRVEIFYVDMIYFDLAAKAAKELMPQRSEIEFDIRDFDKMNEAERLQHDIRALPTVRLFQGDQLVAESHYRFWTVGVLNSWIDKALGQREPGE